MLPTFCGDQNLGKQRWGDTPDPESPLSANAPANHLLFWSDANRLPMKKDKRACLEKYCHFLNNTYLYRFSILSYRVEAANIYTLGKPKMPKAVKLSWTSNMAITGLVMCRYQVRRVTRPRVPRRSDRATKWPQVRSDSYSLAEERCPIYIKQLSRVDKKTSKILVLTRLTRTKYATSIHAHVNDHVNDLGDSDSSTDKANATVAHASRPLE